MNITLFSVSVCLIMYRWIAYFELEFVRLTILSQRHLVVKNCTFWIRLPLSLLIILKVYVYVKSLSFCTNLLFLILFQITFVIFIENFSKFAEFLLRIIVCSRWRRHSLLNIHRYISRFQNRFNLWHNTALRLYWGFSSTYSDIFCFSFINRRIYLHYVRFWGIWTLIFNWFLRCYLGKIKNKAFLFLLSKNCLFIWANRAQLCNFCRLFRSNFDIGFA